MIYADKSMWGDIKTTQAHISLSQSKAPMQHMIELSHYEGGGKNPAVFIWLTTGGL